MGMFENIQIRKDSSLKEKHGDRKPSSEKRPGRKMTNSKNMMTRRDFLKDLVSTTAAATAAGTGILGAAKYFERSGMDQSGRETGKDSSITDKVEEIRGYWKETDQQKGISDQNAESIGKTFQEQIETQDRITLDSATKRAIYRHWREKYAPGTFNYNKGLVAGIERMKPWMEEIKKVFRDNGVPEKFAYLAIAESHFDIDAVSRAQALGPYQITPSTAKLKSFDLVVSSHYDERRDPIRSAELCARHLRYSYEKFGRDWSLALMDYNGGYTNDYMNFVKEREHRETIEFRKEKVRVSSGDTLESLAERYGTSVTLLMRANPDISSPEKLQAGYELKLPHKRRISIGDFNSWLEERINGEIAKELEKSRYTVKKGESLWGIAEKHRINYGLLRTVNPGVDEKNLKAGQSIHIPAHFRSHKKALLKILAGYKENINYPEKFFAIFDIIEEQGLAPERETIKRTLSLPIKQSITLRKIAEKYEVDLPTLKEINPAILNTNKDIPRNTTVRLPNIYQGKRKG